MSRTNLNTRQYRVLHSDGNLLNIVNTGINTELFNIVIPARLLQDSGVIKASIYAVVQVPSGPSRGLRIRARLGGQSVPTLNFSLTSGNRFLELTSILINRADETNQRGMLRAAFSPSNSFGACSVAADIGGASIDTSVDQPYSIDWRWDSAVAGLSFLGRMAFIEYLPEP